MEPSPSPLSPPPPASSGRDCAIACAALLAGTLDYTAAVTNFLLNGGQLTGAQTFNGTLSWLSGNWNTSGTTTIGSGGTLSIANAVNHDFNGHTVVMIKKMLRIR